MILKFTKKCTKFIDGFGEFESLILLLDFLPPRFFSTL